MSTTAELVEITCPKCGEWFTEWRRDAEEPATTSRCPQCGFQLTEDRAVWQEGIWLPDVDDHELADR